jgi:hypothetical protein
VTKFHSVTLFALLTEAVARGSALVGTRASPVSHWLKERHRQGSLTAIRRTVVESPGKLNDSPRSAERAICISEAQPCSYLDANEV